MGKIIVSVTPLPAAYDSRTLKIASSFARAGARSIVFENRVSGGTPDVKNVNFRPLPPTGAAVVQSVEDFTHSNRRSSTAVHVAAVRSFIHLCRFVALYFIIKPLVALASIPAADIYYVHEYRLYPSLALVRRVRGGKIVYDAHDLYDRVLPSTKLNSVEKKILWPLIAFMHRAAARNADIVVTTSDSMATVLAALALRPVLVVRNAHDPSLDSETTPGLRDRLGIPQEQLVCVVVGHRKTGQVLKPAIEALARIKRKTHLVFVGRGYDGIVRDVQPGNLTLHAPGPLLPNEIVPFISDADLSMLLYVDESENYRCTLPNGLFQSVAANLAVLYPDLPEIRNFSTEIYGFPIDPESPDSIERGIREIIDTEAPETQTSSVLWEEEETKLVSALSKLIAE